MQDRAIVTMEFEYETVPMLLSGTSFKDLDWPLTRFQGHNTIQRKVIQMVHNIAYNDLQR